MLWSPYESGGTATAEGVTLRLPDLAGALDVAIADSFRASDVLFVSTADGGTRMFEVPCVTGTPGIAAREAPRGVLSLPFGPARALDATSTFADAAGPFGTQVALAFAVDASGTTPGEVGVAWLTVGDAGAWTLDSLERVALTGITGPAARSVAVSLASLPAERSARRVYVAFAVGNAITLAWYDRCGIDG